jgi:hypothetical protein
VARIGADGAFMSDIRLRVRRLEMADYHVDHAAECLIVGTAIARFRRGSRPVTSSLTVLPLRDSRPSRAEEAVILSGRGVPRGRRRGMTEQ